MKKTYFLLALCLSAAGLSSCSSETDGSDLPETGAPGLPAASVRPLEFPQDDGSTYLNGTAAENLYALLEKTDPAQALGIGETRITDAQYQEIKTFTDDLVKSCADDEAKYRTIFQWVSTNVAYDNSDNDPYPVFINRKAICQGYSNLMKVMLLTQNIPAMVVNGYGWGMGHAWNYAYYNGKWRVCDATNKGDFEAATLSSYTHLSPMMADITLFEDEEFVYDFYDYQLNIASVKTGDEQVTVPYSKNGFRVTSFNPQVALPANIRELYLGKNIQTLGYNLVGLKDAGRNLTAVYVDEANPYLRGYEGAVYERSGESCYLYYVPGSLDFLKLLPMEKAEKNVVLDQPSLTAIEFAAGTKTIEAYAVENCPQLRTAYVPEETVVEENAFYKVHPDFTIIRGSSTGIAKITY